MHILLNFHGFDDKEDKILAGPAVYNLSRYLMGKGHTSTALISYHTTTGEFKLYSVDHSVVIGNRWNSDLNIEPQDLQSEGDTLGAVAKEAIDQFLALPLKPTQPGKHFLKQCLGLYELHVRKAADYGSGSIAMTGSEGILTRTWDKMARLLHLRGYRYELKMKPREAAKEPNNESVLDSWRDLAAYAIMALVHENSQKKGEKP